jgi:hypothetical protein
MLQVRPRWFLMFAPLLGARFPPTRMTVTRHGVSGAFQAAFDCDCRIRASRGQDK